MSNIKKKWTLKKILKEVVITLGLIFIISILLNLMRQPDITEDIYRYELQDINKRNITFSNYQNAPLVVHFWGTWCPTCRFEASTIQALSTKYNVISIAVNSGTNETLRAFMQKNDLDYSVINDPQGTLAQKFDINVYPTTLIYDAQGQLAFSEVGYLTSIGLEARLALIE